MATTSYSRDELLAREAPPPRECVRVTKDDGQRINFIDGVGHEEEEFLVIKEEGHVVKRLPLDSISEWSQQHDYVPQGWKWYGS